MVTVPVKEEMLCTEGHLECHAVTIALNVAIRRTNHVFNYSMTPQQYLQKVCLESRLILLECASVKMGVLNVSVFSIRPTLWSTLDNT